MRIPLPDLMRRWRERLFARPVAGAKGRLATRLWAFAARRPALYGMMTGLGVRVLAMLGRRRGRFRSLPGAGAWTGPRDLPAPEGRTFRALWAERQQGKGS